MDLPLGEWLVRWTVRAAVFCYLVRVFLDSGFWPLSMRWRRYRAARLFWTVGCGLFLLHVLFAFAFYHEFSHRQAYRHTAAETARVTGLDWGGGLYVNYAFTLWWVADTIAWWTRDAGIPYRRRSYLLTLHAAFAFMVFNATVVFGPPVWKWIAGIVMGLAASTWLLRVGRGEPP